MITGALLAGAPVIVGLVARRLAAGLLAANAVLVAAVTTLSRRPQDALFVQDIGFGGVYGQLVLLGLVLAWWQQEAWDALFDAEGEPLVFGHSHRYWHFWLWWSPFHIVRFHRLLQAEGRGRDTLRRGLRRMLGADRRRRR